MSKDIYSRMIETIQQRLAATGIPQNKAISASVSVVNHLCSEIGGHEVYLPKRRPWIDRDNAIRREFNGQNIDVVCEKFQVSARTVYRKLRK